MVEYALILALVSIAAIATLASWVPASTAACMTSSRPAVSQPSRIAPPGRLRPGGATRSSARPSTGSFAAPAGTDSNDQLHVSSHQYDIRDEKGQATRRVRAGAARAGTDPLRNDPLRQGHQLLERRDAPHGRGGALRRGEPQARPGNAAVAAAADQDQVDTAELQERQRPVTPAQVCVDFPNGTSNAGDPVRVTMTFTYIWMPLVGPARHRKHADHVVERHAPRGAPDQLHGRMRVMPNARRPTSAAASS